MLALAFKIAEKAGGLFSSQIQFVTGSKFSHVELWLSGPQDKAMCYSSREPYGTAFQTVDLSDSKLWEIVHLESTPEQENRVLWFCRGDAGRSYDALGILGIGSGLGAHDEQDRFCSEAIFYILQQVFGFHPEIERWMVAPGWPTADGKRFGLYELVKAKAAAAA